MCGLCSSESFCKRPHGSAPNTPRRKGSRTGGGDPRDMRDAASGLELTESPRRLTCCKRARPLRFACLDAETAQQGWSTGAWTAIRACAKVMSSRPLEKDEASCTSSGLLSREVFQTPQYGYVYIVNTLIIWLVSGLWQLDLSSLVATQSCWNML